MSELRLRCPWCLSRTGSLGKRPYGRHMSVNVPKGKFKCWRCRKQGSITQYVAQMLDIDYSIVGHDYSRSNFNHEQFQTESERELPSGYEALYPWEDVRYSVTLRPYLSFLNGRGVNIRKLGKFKIGVVLNPEEKKYRHGYLVYPLLDPKFPGHFVLRKTPESWFKKGPTYLNSRGLPKEEGAFLNGRMLRSDVDRIYVVEGPHDNCQMRNNAVASVGVDLVTAQMKRLRDFKGEVVFAYDGDSWRHSKTAARILRLKGKHNSFWVKIPAGTDPGKLGWDNVGKLPTRT